MANIKIDDCDEAYYEFCKIIYNNSMNVNNVKLKSDLYKQVFM